ncbi:LysR family transcriptional regulator [Actinoplanes sp. DH11]|uniref:LysR family transcriptional regulator n=1 Tax=Actinoplanes sp. DH11 TaxID=2857011 RepID=UPI001E5B0E17|nr:LysR family transcriptional regulator [Actinoplanes sp. DH11]
MLDVRRLRLLHDLDRLGTIAAVAAAHTYTPSAVSQQLSALEREAGVPLLERTGRRVTLTAAGHILVRHTADVLAGLERAAAALAAARTGPAGPFRIGAFPTAVRTILPAALVALARDHPALELQVTELDPSAVPAALRERRLDAGLVHTYDSPGAVPPVPIDRQSIAPAMIDDRDVTSVAPSVHDDRDLESVALLDEAVHLAVPAALPAAGLADLRDQPWIMATPGTLCHEITVRVCQAAGFTPRVRHRADDFTAVLALVAAGQGVSLVPALALAPPPSAAPPAPGPSAPSPSVPSTSAPSPSLPGRPSPAPAPPEPVPPTLAPAGIRLLPAPTRRRTRIAHRRGAATHPAVTALTAALRVAAQPFAPL